MNKKQIKKVRRALGLSQAQFGKTLGVHTLTVSKWERGKVSPESATGQLLVTIYNRIEEEPPPPNIKEIILAALAGAAVGAGLTALLFALFSGRSSRRRKR